MNRQQHGVLSLVFGGVAALIALSVIGSSSIFLAVLYGCILVLAGIAILYSYCAKCRCRATTCGHVIPGMLTRYLPRRLSGRYSIIDRFGILFPAAIILAYPQYWLAGNFPVWGAFWILIIGAAAEVRIFNCPRCTNRFCMVLYHPQWESGNEPSEPDK